MFFTGPDCLFCLRLLPDYAPGHLTITAAESKEELPLEENLAMPQTTVVTNRLRLTNNQLPGPTLRSVLEEMRWCARVCDRVKWRTQRGFFLYGSAP